MVLGLERQRGVQNIGLHCEDSFSALAEAVHHPCRPLEFTLQSHGAKKGAFARSVLLTNGLCTASRLQENPASYLVIDDPFVLSFCTFLITEEHPSVYSGVSL